MEIPIYSRDYLIKLPAQIKREKAYEMIHRVQKCVYAIAASGKSLYYLDMTNAVYEPPVPPPIPGQTVKLYGGGAYRDDTNTYPLPMDELIPLFQERFPGCQVTYKEEWVDTTSNTKTLKKGICIDWS